MHEIGFEFDATDICDDQLKTTIRVSSDEASGNSGPRGMCGAFVDESDNVSLRASRDGSGDGRLYIVTAVATDGSGNVGECSAEVIVPHSMGGELE